MTSSPSAAARTIAAGGNPSWEYTARHPQHGELTFTARLPLAGDAIRHSVAIDNALAGLDVGVDPRGQTMIMAAAIAGLRRDPEKAAGHGLLVKLPVVERTVIPADETTPERTVNVFYDVDEESNIGYLIALWLDFSAWRNELLSDKTVEAVGESFGGPVTSSGGSSTSSAEATALPSPTRAS